MTRSLLKGGSAVFLQSWIFPLLCHTWILHHHLRQRDWYFSATVGSTPPILQGDQSQSLSYLTPHCTSEGGTCISGSCHFAGPRADVILPEPQALLVSIHSFITRFTIYRSGALQQTIYGSTLACPVLRYSTMCMKASGLEKSRAERIPLPFAGHHRPHIPRMEGQELPWRQRSQWHSIQ